MTDEGELDGIELIDPNSEMAISTYDSHAAQLAQAFGNLLVQSARLPPDHWLAPIAMNMLERVAANVETAPKGSVKAIRGGNG